MKCFVVSLKNSDRRKDFDHRFKILIINFLTLSLNAQVINSTQLLQNQYMEGA
ncbi:Uncharacterised protein [Escherichia coli]|nr:Uncharacterised protein [Escherichia coli]